MFELALRLRPKLPRALVEVALTHGAIELLRHSIEGDFHHLPADDSLE
jgi:hypothetical protein